MFKALLGGNKLLIGYTTCATMYGFVRKVDHVHNAQVEEYDFKTNTKKISPMLTTDKVTIIGYATVMSPIFFPLWLHSDVRAYEMKVKNIDTHGDQPKRISDYLLS